MSCDSVGVLSQDVVRFKREALSGLLMKYGQLIHHDRSLSVQAVFQISGALQTVLTTSANELSRLTGVIQRQRKFSGACLAQTFVLGWLSNPRATLDELAVMAASCGAAVKPQAVAQRMTSKLADFFKQLLEVTTSQVVVTQPVTTALLQRFNGVYLLDSTVIKLPDSFAEQYPGCGGGAAEKTNAAVKFQVRMNLTNGGLDGPFPEVGKASDQSSCVQRLPLPAGALRIADLGYFGLPVLAELAAQSVFWISRIQVHTAIFHNGERLDLCDWLYRRKIQAIDLKVELGATERLPCRLFAVRCPPEVVRRRLAAAKKDARRRGRTLSKAQRQWCRWTVMVTNAPADMLNTTEAIVLYRARWQIELLFKLWKQQGLVDESRYSSDEAKLVEIYAKMIGLVIQHWMLITTVWSYTDRSLMKASKAIQKHVVLLVAYFQSRITAEALFEQLTQALSACARINRRKSNPNTYQTLENPDILGYEGLN